MTGSNAFYSCWPEPACGWVAGAGLRVGEMTQIKAEDIDFSKGYLHVQALNAKFKKPRTVVLLPKVADAIAKQLAGRSAGCSLVIVMGISPRVKSKIFSMALPQRGPTRGQTQG